MDASLGGVKKASRTYDRLLFKRWLSRKLLDRASQGAEGSVEVLQQDL